MQVLITGAAGLIGRELCGVLAGRGHGVVALLHRATTLARNDGRPLPSAPMDGPPRGGCVATIRGDVREPGFGLPPDSVAALADGLDLVIHAAAVTGFDLAPELYRQVNVAGTAHALAVAEQAGGRPIPFLQVSTAFVCGARSGTVPEAMPETAASDGPFANGYEASKAAAERLVLAAARRGLMAVIARPSIVVGAHGDGAIGAFGNIYQLIRLVTGGLIRMLPAAAAATLDLVPIDHVVEGLADIAERMPQAAGIIHLVSGQPVPVHALRTLALAYPHLDAPRFVDPASFDPARLGAAERRLYPVMTAPYASYLRRDPRFEASALASLSGRCCPPVDGPYLRRVVDYAVAAGYLRGHRSSG